jgi:hypothetical protein
MATNILLLGAGFSKNWGAPITSEFFQALIADPEVRANREIHSLLWRNRRNFEDALAQLQYNFRHNSQANREPLLLMQHALLRVFERINRIFRNQDFELHQERLTVDRNRTVVEFLAKFDAIFTLNQDLLLEIHYLDHVRNQTTNRRWNGNSMPGMQPTGGVDSGAPFSGRIWTPKGDYTIPQNTQPYFKLHGSTNWKDTGANEDIMIMGGGKDGAIQANPVLKLLQEFFTAYVRHGKTRVTVIGYGFGDAHINAILKDSIENHGLLMYVIDPRGANIAYDMRGFGRNQIGPAVTEFEEWFQKGLYSASIIPFRRLLIDESVDRGVLADFLDGR